MATNNEAIVRYQKALCACGHHIYKGVLEAATGETLVSVVEPRINSHKRNAVAVEKDGKVTGHFPRKVLYLWNYFSEKRWKLSLYCDY